jgi:hypothetical protein
MRRVLAATFMTAALVAPAFAEVHVGINIPAPPSIVISSPPRLVVVPGVPTVQYAPDLGVNFFVYDNSYYTYHNGGWFTSTSYGGPWTYVERVHVPRPIISVPNHYYRVGPRYGHRWDDRRHVVHRGHVSSHHRYRGDVRHVPPGHSRSHHRGDHRDDHR